MIYDESVLFWFLHFQSVTHGYFVKYQNLISLLCKGRAHPSSGGLGRHVVLSLPLRLGQDGDGAARQVIGMRRGSGGVRGGWTMQGRKSMWNREVAKEDFASFECMLTMHVWSNLKDCNRKSYQVQDRQAKIELFGSSDPQNIRITEDASFGKDSDLETVYLAVYWMLCGPFTAEDQHWFDDPTARLSISWSQSESEIMLHSSRPRLFLPWTSCFFP